MYSWVGCALYSYVILEGLKLYYIYYRFLYFFCKSFLTDGVIRWGIFYLLYKGVLQVGIKWQIFLGIVILCFFLRVLIFFFGLSVLMRFFRLFLYVCICKFSILCYFLEIEILLLIQDCFFVLFLYLVLKYRFFSLRNRVFLFFIFS